MFQASGILYVEILPVPRTTFANLDKRRLEDYFGRVRGISDLPFRDEEWVQLLIKLELMVETEYSEEVCTLVALWNRNGEQIEGGLLDLLISKVR